MRNGGANMEITDNLFVFVNAVHRESEDETIKLNIIGSELHFFHNDNEYVIDTEELLPNTSTCMISNSVTGNTYVLYNFKELCQALDMTPQEYLNVLKQRCFMQIDKNNFGELFIKVFCLQGTSELASDTNDFYDKGHYTVDFIHPLDVQYSFSVSNIEGCLHSFTEEDYWVDEWHREPIDDYIELYFVFRQSDFIRDKKLYCNYGTESVECVIGENKIKFKYKPNEDIYFGKPLSRNKNKCIEVEKLIHNNGDYYNGKVL